jgi:hypothetical protein
MNTKKKLGITGLILGILVIAGLCLPAASIMANEIGKNQPITHIGFNPPKHNHIHYNPPKPTNWIKINIPPNNNQLPIIVTVEPEMIYR